MFFIFKIVHTYNIKCKIHVRIRVKDNNNNKYTFLYIQYLYFTLYRSTVIYIIYFIIFIHLLCEEKQNKIISTNKV